MDNEIALIKLAYWFSPTLPKTTFIKDFKQYLNKNMTSQGIAGTLKNFWDREFCNNT